MIMAMVGEKALKVDLKSTLLGLFKADSLEQRLVLYLADVYCVVNAREINKIERASAHNEQSFKILKFLAGGDIVNETAAVGELELRHARKFAVGICGVREQIGIKFYSAGLAELILFFL